jgi:hypothetical protein
MIVMDSIEGGEGNMFSSLAEESIQPEGLKARADEEARK